MQTIIMFLGRTGSGKSALASAIAQRSRHLIDISLPEDIFDAKIVNCFDSLNPDTIQAIKAGNPIRPFIDKAIGTADYLLLEPWCTVERIIAECADDYELIHIHPFAPPWLLASRVYLRYQRLGALEKYERIRKQLYKNVVVVRDEHIDRKELDVVTYAQTCTPGVRTILVDACDWPVREIDEKAARALVEIEEPREPDATDVNKQYQKSLRIRDKWYGVTSGTRFEFERKRLDDMLPADMTNMTMLDIGASEGGFCFEAINRGALYCQAVEIRPDWVELIKSLRNAVQVPIGTAQLDITKDGLPLLQMVETPTHYSLALVLNVLHHIRPAEQTEAVLSKILSACDSIVIEGPFCEGVEPAQIGLAPYPSAMSIPDAWVESVSAKHGFGMDFIGPSNMQIPQRRIWKLSRRK